MDKLLQRHARGLKLMFKDGFDVEFTGTELHQRPDFTINWILGQFIERLPAADKKRLQRMRVADLLSQPPTGPFWTDLLNKLPDDVMSEFACREHVDSQKKITISVLCR